MAVKVKQIVACSLFFFMLYLYMPACVYSQDTDAKKKEELLKKLEELKKKKAQINQDTKVKLEKQGANSSNMDELIARYEDLNKKCAGTKNDRCADVEYSLSTFYYDKSRDEYSVARQKYEDAMKEWDKKRKGPEPVNPVPNYSKALQAYKKSVADYPNYVKADEGYFQIGTILTLQGDVDGAKSAYNSLITNMPNSARASAAHFRLSEFCFMDRDFTCALKHIEKIKFTEIYPEVQQMALYRKAEIYYNRGDFDAAADIFFDYIEKCDKGEFPKRDLRDEAMEYLAICFSDMPDGAKKAIEYFQKKGARSYQDYVLFTIGTKNFTHGQYEQAVAALGTALKQFPNYKEAPQAQQMIIACYIIKKKYEDANKEREKMVQLYNPKSDWVRVNSTDKAALENGMDEVKKALAAIPIYYHADAQKQKNKALFELSLQKYQLYIDMFPEDKWKVYEFKYNMAEIYNSLRDYEKAATCYNFVATQDLKTFPKFVSEMDTLGMDAEDIEQTKKEGKKNTPVSVTQEDAGYNAIVCLDNLRKERMQKDNMNDEQAYKLPETQRLIEYIHQYYLRFPKSDNAAEVLILAGNMHLAAKNYDAAVEEFTKLTNDFGSSKYGNNGLRLLANAYASAGKFDNAFAKLKIAMGKEKPGTKEYSDVVDLAAGVLLKKGNATKQAGDLKGAVEVFKSIFKEYPKSNFADAGWFEAGACLEELKDMEGAALTFKEIGEKFPNSKIIDKSYVRAAEIYKKLNKSEEAAKIYELAATKIVKEDFALPSLSSAAECYKDAKQYDKAGAMYEMILKKYPADKRTPLAIYNGGLIYEKGQFYEKAIGLYTVLATKYPQSEYAPEGFYSIGLCYEKLKKYPEMASAYLACAEKFADNKAKQIEAYSNAAEAYAYMGKYVDAEKTVALAIDIYEKFKGSLDPAAGAVAYFKQGELNQIHFESIKLVGKKESEVRQRISEKTKLLEPILKSYAKAIEFGIGEYTIRSTYNIGQCFVLFADDYKNQTLFGTKEQKLANNIKILSDLDKYYSKAIEKFQWVVNTSNEQNIVNEWTDKSKVDLMRLLYKGGMLFEQIGEIFKSAPVPKGLAADEKQAYQDVLEEKYLEALDAALPKYKAAARAAAELGITNAWVDSIKLRISFINPATDDSKSSISKNKDSINVDPANKTQNTTSSSPVKPAGAPKDSNTTLNALPTKSEMMYAGMSFEHANWFLAEYEKYYFEWKYLNIESKQIVDMKKQRLNSFRTRDASKQKIV